MKGLLIAMNLFVKKRQIYFYQGLIFLVILVYSVQDLLASRNMGFYGVSRRGVYLSLVTLIILLGIFFMRPLMQCNLFQKELHFPPIKKSLFFLGGWFLLVNLVQRADIWLSITHLGICALWFLTYNFFSEYLRKTPNSFRYIKIFIFFIFLLYVFFALSASFILSNKLGRIVTINLAYNVLVFFPWLTLMNQKVQRFGVFLILLVLFFSMKRGAIIVFPFMFTAYLVCKSKIQRKQSKKLLLSLLFLFIFGLGLFLANHFSGGHLGSRFSAEELSSGSGRVNLFISAIEDIQKRSLWSFLIGGGSGSSVKSLGNVVHNEWLDFLFNFGLIGTCLLVLLFFSFFKELRWCIVKFSPFSPGYAPSIVYLCFVSMYGMIFFAHSTLYIIAFMGAANGLTKHYNLRNL
jgi:O-antigen ligase